MTGFVGGLVAACALLALGVGCGELDPEVGPDRIPVPGFEPIVPDGGGDGEPGETCDLVDSDPETDVTFAEVTGTVLRGFCSCHVDEGGAGMTIGGLDLRTVESALLGGRRGGSDDIVPGDPCASLLVGKISDDPPFGSRMPFSRSPLTAENKQIIIDWIAEGARP